MGSPKFAGRDLRTRFFFKITKKTKMSKKEVLLYKITIMLSVERAESWAAKEFFYPKYNFIFLRTGLLGPIQWAVWASYC
jgi:hypothetical protein